MVWATGAQHVAPLLSPLGQYMDPLPAGGCCGRRHRLCLPFQISQRHRYCASPLSDVVIFKPKVETRYFSYRHVDIFSFSLLLFLFFLSFHFLFYIFLSLSFSFLSPFIFFFFILSFFCLFFTLIFSIF